MSGAHLRKISGKRSLHQTLFFENEYVQTPNRLHYTLLRGVSILDAHYVNSFTSL